MLQNNAVRTLQIDNEIRVAQQTRSEQRVPGGPVTITSQPTACASLPLPVSTVEQNAKFCTTHIPVTGYSFLADLPSIHIEQTCELNPTFTSVSTETRYVVRSPLGDAVYATSQYSAESTCLLWSSARPFQVHVIDKSYQEAMVFHKKLSLGFMCCQPKSLEVWIPPGNILGRIVQSPTLTQPEFFIEDAATNSPVFCIECPANSGFLCYCLPKEVYFKVHSGGDLRASIDRKWSIRQSQYTTNIYFSDSTLNAKERALILGAAFLLENLYFQTESGFE